MSFGIPVRNGLGIGLRASTALSTRGGVPPGAPTSVTATTSTATTASVSFTAPASPGIPAVITSYTVTSSPGGITATGSSSPITVTGLTTGTTYTFTVTATNASGTGPASAASNSVTPADPSYMAVLKDASISLYGTGGDIDSSGNIYSVGYADTASSDDPLVLTKYNSAGTILFQYQYTRSANNFREASCAVASSGDIYIWARNENGDGHLIKLDSSGVVQWANTHSSGLGSGGPIYIDGTTIYTGSFTNTGALLCSFSASGTLNWTRKFETGNRSGQVTAITVSPSGYVYVGASTNISGGSNATIVRLDASGNNVWIREVSVGSNASVGAIVTDASNNLYVAFNSSSFSGINVYTSSFGGILSTNTSSAVSINNMRRDGSGNIYAYSNSNRLFKLDSSFNQQFQRLISGTSQSFNYGFMKVLGGRIYVNANNNNSSVSRLNFFAMKVPDDGTLTGTRSVAGVDYSYATSATYSWSAGSTPSSFTSATQSTVSATLSSVTVTRSTPTYTQTVTTF
jgi:hypothetical protein